MAFHCPTPGFLRTRFLLAIAVATLASNAPVSGTTRVRGSSFQPFPAGIYYAQPATEESAARLRLLDGTVPFELEVSRGFDLREDTAVGNSL